MGNLLSTVIEVTTDTGRTHSQAAGYTISNLPTETLVAISHYLSRKDAWSFAMTSRTHYAILREHILYNSIRLGSYRFSLEFGMGPSRGSLIVPGLSSIEKDIMIMDVLDVGSLLKNVTLGFDVKDTKTEPGCQCLLVAVERFASMAKNLRSAKVYGTDNTALYVTLIETLGSRCSCLTELSIQWTWKSSLPMIFLKTHAILKNLKKLTVAVEQRQRDYGVWNDDVYDMTLATIIEIMITASMKTLVELDISITSATPIANEGVRWHWLAAPREHAFLLLKTLKYRLDINPRGGNTEFVVGCSLATVFPSVEELCLEQPFNGAFLHYDRLAEPTDDDPLSIKYEGHLFNTPADIMVENHDGGLITVPDISEFFRGLKGCKRLHLDFGAMHDIDYWDGYTMDRATFMDCMEKAVAARVTMMLRFADLMPALEYVEWPVRNERLTIKVSVGLKRYDDGGIDDYILDCDCEELWHVPREALVKYFDVDWWFKE